MHEVPQYIERAILRAGGKTEGGLPLFRVIYGRDKFLFDADGVMFQPYDLDRWHLEKWYQGDYEHCYKFGVCPHVTKEKPSWCDACKLSGGEFLPLNLTVIERTIHLLLMSMRMQDAAKQKAALMKKEEDKLVRKENIVREAMNDAKPSHVPRSYNPNFDLTAREVLGNSPFKQIHRKEVKDSAEDTIRVPVPRTA